MNTTEALNMLREIDEDVAEQCGTDFSRRMRRATDTLAEALNQHESLAQLVQPATPLTDERLLEELKRLDPRTARLPLGFKAFARAIEAAHGITGEQPAQPKELP